MMRSMHPPERAAFDPAIEGARYRLSRDELHALWQRARDDSWARTGRDDAQDAARHFHALAEQRARVVARVVGRTTRVAMALADDALDHAAVDHAVPRAPIQHKLAVGGAAMTTGLAAASRPERFGSGAPLPFRATIQRLFGRHQVGSIVAHTTGPAVAAAVAMGAEAFATGDHVAFAAAPTLYTAAHEAAHVIQQRAGVVHGVGAAGDVHERHADHVADLVVRGESAEAALDRLTAGDARPAVQHKLLIGGDTPLPIDVLPHDIDPQIAMLCSDTGRARQARLVLELWLDPSGAAHSFGSWPEAIQAALAASPLHEAIRARKPLVVARLLDASADKVLVDAPDADGKTPLHVAVARGDRYLVDLLLTARARTNKQDADGNTPLHLAVSADRIDLVERLVSYGADARIPNHAHKSPFQLAKDLKHAKLQVLLTTEAVDFEVKLGHTLYKDPQVNQHAARLVQKLQQIIAYANTGLSRNPYQRDERQAIATLQLGIHQVLALMLSTGQPMPAQGKTAKRAKGKAPQVEEVSSIQGVLQDPEANDRIDASLGSKLGANETFRGGAVGSSPEAVHGVIEEGNVRERMTAANMFTRTGNVDLFRIVREFDATLEAREVLEEQRKRTIDPPIHHDALYFEAGQIMSEAMAMVALLAMTAMSLEPNVVGILFAIFVAVPVALLTLHQALIDAAASVQANETRYARHGRVGRAVANAAVERKLAALRRLGLNVPLLRERMPTDFNEHASSTLATYTKHSDIEPIASQDDTRQPRTGNRSSERTERDLQETPLSERERAFMKQKGEDLDAPNHTMPWVEGATDLELKDDHPWVKQMIELSIPLVAGPSGTTEKFLQLAEVLGLPVKEMALLCLAWMLPGTGNDHSFMEIMCVIADHVDEIYSLTFKRLPPESELAQHKEATLPYERMLQLLGPQRMDALRKELRYPKSLPGYTKAKGTRPEPNGIGRSRSFAFRAGSETYHAYLELQGPPALCIISHDGSGKLDLEVLRRELATCAVEQRGVAAAIDQLAELYAEVAQLANALETASDQQAKLEEVSLKISLAPALVIAILDSLVEPDGKDGVLDLYKGIQFSALSSDHDYRIKRSRQRVGGVTDSPAVRELADKLKQQGVGEDEALERARKTVRDSIATLRTKADYNYAGVNYESQLDAMLNLYVKSLKLLKEDMKHVSSNQRNMPWSTLPYEAVPAISTSKNARQAVMYAVGDKKAPAKRRKQGVIGQVLVYLVPQSSPNKGVDILAESTKDDKKQRGYRVDVRKAGEAEVTFLGEIPGEYLVAVIDVDATDDNNAIAERAKAIARKEAASRGGLKRWAQVVDFSKPDADKRDDAPDVEPQGEQMPEDDELESQLATELVQLVLRSQTEGPVEALTAAATRPELHAQLFPSLVAQYAGPDNMQALLGFAVKILPPPDFTKLLLLAIQACDTRAVFAVITGIVDYLPDVPLEVSTALALCAQSL